MKREAYNEHTKTHTYVITVDDEIAAYIEQNHIRDANAYMVKLLEAEMQRQRGQGQRA
jgi:hypothetical protein